MESAINNEFRRYTRFGTTCINWLAPKGYQIEYRNHPLNKRQEIHFCKVNGLRVICILEEGDKYGYCQLQIDIFAHPISFELHSISFTIGDERFEEYTKMFNEYVNKIKK